MAQIVGYLTAPEARHFHDCAAACGVGASTLANLLISRELTLRRLTALQRTPAPPRLLPSDTKVVAHLALEERKTLFSDHAERHGMKMSAAAALLFRTELQEHWLLTSLGR